MALPAFPTVYRLGKARCRQPRRQGCNGMDKSNKMLIDSTHPEETRVVVLKNGRVEEFDYESAARKLLRGNIYLAKVTRVEPSLQAAFIEYGGNRHGFLAFNEIHPDYYQIPVADREALKQEEAAIEAEEEARADARAEARSGRGRGRGERGGDGDQDRDHGNDHAGHDDHQHDHHRDEHGDAHSHSEAAGNDHGHEHDRSTEHQVPAEQPATGPHDHGHDNQPLASIALDARDSGHTVSEPMAPDIARGDDRHADHDRISGQDRDRGDEGARDVADHIVDIGDQGEAPEIVTPIDLDIVGSEDAMEEVPERPRRQRRRQYKIQEVMRRRQIILVQVVKEERGNKGAALTTYLSLAGRYTVLMPNTGRGGGISRKITQAQDRKRLKAIAQELEVPEGMGLIIRTAGASRTKQEIKRDFEYLMRLWESVRDLTLESTAPSLVYEEGNLIKRSIRDLYSKDVEEIVVAGEPAYSEAHDFMSMLMPSHARNVIKYEHADPLFARYRIEQQLNAMFSPHVTLKSGGYLVINQTEALVAIDVNSGKSTREFSIEETALNTNLEASDEIARQLKLRDLAGLIVIDFIDMEERRNNRKVENRLKDALRHDRARIQVGRISHFGLMEMSRQRLRTGVLEGSTSQCPHCQGTGIIRSTESVALAVLRGIEDHLMRDSRSSVTAATTAHVALYILNNKRAYITEMESRFGVSIAVQSSERMHGANFSIEKSAAPLQSKKPAQRAAVSMDWGFDGEEHEADAPSLQEIEEIEDVDDEPRERPSREGQEPRGESRGGGRDEGRSEDDGAPRGRKRRRRRGRGGNGDGRPADGERFAQDGGRERGADVQPGDGPRRERADRSDEPRDDDVVETIGGEAAGGDDVNDGRVDANDGGADGEKRGRRRRRGRRGGRRRERDGDAPIGGDGLSAGGDGGERADGDGREHDQDGAQAPHSHDDGATVLEQRDERPMTERDAAPADGQPRGERPRRRDRGGGRDRGEDRVRDDARSTGEARHTVSAPPEPRVEQRAPEPERVALPVPESAPLPIPEPAVADPSRPARKGWWQRRVLGE